MKFIANLIFIVLTLPLMAQKLIVQDAFTSRTISNYQVECNQRIYFSDSSGLLFLDSACLKRKMIVRADGYLNMNWTCSGADTLYLFPRTSGDENLPTITVKLKGPKLIKKRIPPLNYWGFVVGRPFVGIFYQMNFVHTLKLYQPVEIKIGIRPFNKTGPKVHSFTVKWYMFKSGQWQNIGTDSVEVNIFKEKFLDLNIPEKYQTGYPLGIFIIPADTSSRIFYVGRFGKYKNSEIQAMVMAVLHKDVQGKFLLRQAHRFEYPPYIKVYFKKKTPK